MEGKCDGKVNVIAEAPEGGHLDFEKLRWIKNTGTCRVEIYPLDTEGKRCGIPAVVESQQQIAEYAVPFNGSPKKIVFVSDEKSEGSCSIELDSSKIKPFQAPAAYVVKKEPIKRTVEGKCNGEETLLSAPNGGGLLIFDLKNVGACPIEIYSTDKEGERMKDKDGNTIKSVSLNPNQSTFSFDAPYGAWEVLFKCQKGPGNGTCLLEIKDRDIAYQTPDNGEPAKAPEPARIKMEGDCAPGATAEPVTLAWTNKAAVQIKWIKNTGDCPVVIYSANALDDTVSDDKIVLQPGQMIERYEPGTHLNRLGLPERGEQIVFRCTKKPNARESNCSIEFDRP